MSRWLARLAAKTHECVTAPTAKTDRTPMAASDAVLLTVLAVPEERHTQKIRAASNDEAGEVRPIKSNPYLSREAADSCHAPEWNDAEIFAATPRAVRFVRMGLRRDADYLAELLTLRDRDGDDRRLCLECTWLDDTGRCLAAAAGRIPGADRRLEPVQTILQRCGAFGLRKGLV